MVSSVSLKLDGENLIDYEVDGVQECIPYCVLNQIFDYVSPDKIEYRYATVAGNYLIFSIQASSGQTGLIAVWDLSSKKIVHYTSAPYTKYVKLIEGEIWALADVAYWGKAQSYYLEKISFGLMDSNIESETLVKDIHLAEYPEKVVAEYKGRVIEFER